MVTRDWWHRHDSIDFGRDFFLHSRGVVEAGSCIDIDHCASDVQADRLLAVTADLHG